MREIATLSELVANAERIIKRLTPHQAFEMLQNETEILLYLRDIRELARTGKIEDAIRAPRGILEFWVDPNSPYHKPVFNADKSLILFCASFWRSALAAKTHMEMVFERIFDVEG
ncbi:MAG: rhodanese-like domain-containing protein, partial [Alphaproteobacteria bacterium]